METQFEWDIYNLKHLLLDHPERDITIEEIESVFNDPNKIIEFDRVGKFGENEYYCIGKGNDKIIRFVVFVIRNKRIRPFSARTASRKLRKIYDDENK